MINDSADTSTRAARAHDATWDPYDVWLTRIKQPRDIRRARVLVVNAPDRPAAPERSSAASREPTLLLPRPS